MSMSEQIIFSEDLEIYNQEIQRVETSKSIAKAQLFIKFFSNLDYANDLMNGRFFCNTTGYYRDCKFEGIGDVHESVSYHGAYIPELRIGHITLESMVNSTQFPIEETNGNITVSLNKEGFEQGWLHCWFVFDLIDEVHSLVPLLNDLQRIRQEFGVNFVSFRTQDLGLIVERLSKVTDDKIRTSRVGYSDNRMVQNIACKRAEYSYQREFRFVLSECDIDEKKPKVYELGDMSDIFSLNSPISGKFDNTGETFKITKDDIEVDSAFIKKI